MSCRPNFQTNALDRYEWPERLYGMVAPLAVWEYCTALRDRIATLERELEKARAGGPVSERESLFTAQTETTGILRPLLFYDFNVPQEPDASFLCLPHGFLPTYPGDRVVFGIADDLVLNGVVDSLDPRGLVKVFEETEE